MRKIIVTGATSGIGLGTIKALLEKTDDFIISISRDKVKIEKCKDNLKEFSNRIEFYSVDISDECQVTEFVKNIADKYDCIDGLVNAAGVIKSGGIEECSFEDWNLVMNINLNGPFLITKAVIPLLKKSTLNPSIVNISSVNSIRCGSSLPYSVSKAATDMFTKSLALSLAQYQIRANSVNPGVVISNLQKSAGICKSEEEYQDFLKRMEACHPLGRIGEPSDIAGAILYLLSADAKWVTGAVLSVDGGRAI